MNKITLIGNLTADPEQRTTPNGIAVCSFRIAVNRRFKDADGNAQTDYIPVTCWRQLAELCGRYLAKGRKVGVVGTLQSRNYEDKSGNKRTTYDVIADEVEFLTPKGESNNAQNEDIPSGFTEMDDSALQW